MPAALCLQYWSCTGASKSSTGCVGAVPLCLVLRTARPRYTEGQPAVTRTALNFCCSMRRICVMWRTEYVGGVYTPALPASHTPARGTCHGTRHWSTRLRSLMTHTGFVCLRQRGYTPLHKAAASGDADTVRLLVSKGANVNSASTYMGVRSRTSACPPH